MQIDIVYNHQAMTCADLADKSGQGEGKTDLADKSGQGEGKTDLADKSNDDICRPGR